MPGNESFYEILGVDRSASVGQIRAAYLKLAHEYHPDRYQNNPLKDLAAQKLVSINQAYHTLSDPGRRAAYDARPRSTSGSPAAPLRPSASLTTQRILTTVVLLLAIPLILRFGLPLLRGVFRLLRALFTVL